MLNLDFYEKKLNVKKNLEIINNEPLMKIYFRHVLKISSNLIFKFN